MTTERLNGVSIRLLLGAALLTLVGLALVLHHAWQQIGVSYTEDGSPLADSQMSVESRVRMLVWESSYRPIGFGLTAAAMLIAAAVVFLHHHPSWDHVRRLRHEVLGVGALVLVIDAALVLAHLFVLTAPGGAPGTPDAAFGPPSMTEVILGNLAALLAPLLLLVGALLWWLRLGPPVTVESDDEQPDEASVRPDDGVPQPDTSAQRRTVPDDEPVIDVSQDWSPEDFRRPR